MTLLGDAVQFISFYMLLSQARVIIGRQQIGRVQLFTLYIFSYELNFTLLLHILRLNFPLPNLASKQS